MTAIAKTARRASRVTSAPVETAPVESANPFAGISDMPDLELAVYDAVRYGDVAERAFRDVGVQLRAELRALKVDEEWGSENDATKAQKEAQAKIARSFKVAYITARAITSEPLFVEAENPIAAARAAVVKWMGEKNDQTRPAWWRKADNGARAMLSRAQFAEGLKTVEARGGNRKVEAPASSEAPKVEAPKVEAPAPIPAPISVTVTDFVPTLHAMLMGPISEALIMAERNPDAANATAASKGLIALAHKMQVALRKAHGDK